MGQKTWEGSQMRKRWHCHPEGGSLLHLFSSPNFSPSYKSLITAHLTGPQNTSILMLEHQLSYLSAYFEGKFNRREFKFSVNKGRNLTTQSTQSALKWIFDIHFILFRKQLLQMSPFFTIFYEGLPRISTTFLVSHRESVSERKGMWDSSSSLAPRLIRRRAACPPSPPPPSLYPPPLNNISFLPQCEIVSL